MNGSAPDTFLGQTRAGGRGVLHSARAAHPAVQELLAAVGLVDGAARATPLGQTRVTEVPQTFNRWPA